MNRILAVYFALALVPTSGAFATDKDAVMGGAAGAALTQEDRQVTSSPAKVAVQPPPFSGYEEIYAELPPPPRIIAVRDTGSRSISQDRTGNWKTQQYE